MRVGLITRETRSGLGHQTLEIWTHLRPAETVVVQLRNKDDRDLGWYQEEPIPWLPGAPLHGAFDRLVTCDVVISAETYYDWTLPERLAHAGVPTILIANPELFDGHWTSHVWVPTQWQMREGWLHVPHPAPVHRYPRIEPLIEPLTIVHPTSVAMLDRNGTEIARRVQRIGRWKQIKAGPLGQPFENYWERDPGMAASLIPRRYGGLCLPALEAMSAGTPVMMPAIPPNDSWPIVPIPYIDGRSAPMKGGRFQLVDFRPQAVVEVIRTYLRQPERIEELRLQVRAWAEARSWDALLPTWQRHLEEVANSTP